MEDKNTKFPLLSVIVPVYNAEKTILRLLASLLENQISHEIPLEIILVDDASTDKTLQILNEYRSANIKTVQIKKNSGTSFARNEGLRCANGELVFFADSDDTISPNFFASFQNIYSPDVDCYLFDMLWEYKNHRVLNHFVKNRNDKRNIIRMGGACNKIFKKSQVPFFDSKVKYYEDTLFLFKYLSCNQTIKVSHIEGVQYIYNKTNENAKSSSFHKNIYFRVMEEIFKICKESDELTQMICLETFLGVAFTTYYPLDVKVKVAFSALKNFYRFLWAVLKNPARSNLITIKQPVS